MDPYSAEGELVNIHTALHQGQYQSVVDFDTSAFSSSNSLAVRVLKARAQCALGQYDQVLSSISPSNATNTPDLAAVRVFANYGKSNGEDEDAVAEAESVLAAAGKADEALSLLNRHQGSLDAVALIIQIHLGQNRTDLAVSAAKSARSFAQDALLVNLAESWIGLRQGGDKYQQAFYVFEELAQSPSSSSTSSLIAQAVSELHLGRLQEAEAALQQAIEAESENTDALANLLVLNTILGREKEAQDAKEKLQSKGHALMDDLAAKREAFEAACAKYNPKFEP
ncbi:hypothetical protein H2203_000584 [Taxawa tesnikishii (nom. ined.)]|nr:hypothetical protein H2203_000584 [Dothideales sp. JES 119]